MNSKNEMDKDVNPHGVDMAGTQGAGRPEWADGLRQLYDSVVDEPIPDAFRDLLAQLDSKN